MIKSALLFVVLGATGCATSVSYAPFRASPVDRQLPANSVEVFFTPPRCPFIELGMLESQGKFSTLEEGLITMREAAGARGADGIILVDHQDSGGEHRSPTHSSRAIAIARDATCATDPASQQVGNGAARSYQPGGRGR